MDHWTQTILTSNMSIYIETSTCLKVSIRLPYDMKSRYLSSYQFALYRTTNHSNNIHQWIRNQWCFIGAAPSINPSVLPKFVMKIPSYKCRVLQHFADMELFVKYIDRTTNHSSNIHHWIRFIQYLQTISKLLHYGLMGSYSMVLSWSSTIYSSRCPS